jgi:hypothetical protein
MSTEININDQCEVTLTVTGYSIAYDWSYLKGKGCMFSFLPDKFDKDNPPVLKLALWELMQIFGPAMYMGVVAPFKDNKILITKS